jgi:hypothetical protein
LINAMIARLPSSVFEFYRRYPSLVFLSGEPVAAAPVDLDRDFSDVLSWTETKVVLLHRSLLPIDQAQTLQAFLDRQPQLSEVGVEADLVIYRVKP